MPAYMISDIAMLLQQFVLAMTLRLYKVTWDMQPHPLR